jgi:3-oxoadipate enol-lactonase
VLAFDQRGHARGLSCAGSFRLEDCADDVAAVAAVLCIDRVVAVGYSMGGLIAQLVWRRHPKLITGLVLCATAHNLAGAARDRFSALVMPALILRAMAAANGWLSIAPWLRADLLGTHLLDTDSKPAGQAWALQQMRRTPLGRRWLRCRRSMGSAQPTGLATSPCLPRRSSPGVTGWFRQPGKSSLPPLYPAR